MQKLSDSIEKLSGVGTKRAQLYKKLNINAIGDLLVFYPRSYIDLTSPVGIEEAVLDENNVITAKVYKKQGEQRIRKGLSIFKVYVTDGSLNMAITIFNSKYVYDELEIDKEYTFYGKVTGNLIKREMNSPMFFKACGGNRVIPIYPLTEGLTNKQVTANVRQAIDIWGDCLLDSLPNDIRLENELSSLRYAIENIHFPKDIAALDIAKKRLVFEELLVLSLGLKLISKRKRNKTELSIENEDISEFINSLPFTLTSGQLAAINDGIADMKKNEPMNRLVQGDVGCGKTMVAAALCYVCAKNNMQSVVMAPTQILAAQHFKTMSELLEPLNIKCVLIKGAQSAKERAKAVSGICSGEYSVIIGTHALLQENIVFKKLALVVTDEQHRFGVEQRATLAAKGDNPHTLVMSATPIPRTLALIIYGDLDISVIKELPKGRIPIKTLVINSKKRERALSFIKENIEKGRQAYIVCPLIDESESELVSTALYVKKLADTPLKGLKTAVMHGKLKPKEKEELMSQFKNGEIDMLISTTVVEVGVDVPNATIMLIENAERFGLSQLHQLRGRVGRGSEQSYCILLSDNAGEENKHRLKVMAETSDGFVIAKEDLNQRGPGDFFGRRQHGLPELKVANLIDDMETVRKTQEVAEKLLLADSSLSSPEHKPLLREVKGLFSENGQAAFN